MLWSTLTSVFGQKEASIWYFGNRFGLSFANGNVTRLNDANQQFAPEGSSVTCDTTGKLLFYTNGGGRLPASGQNTGYIWNANHQVMVDMQGTRGGGWSAQQSSVIVPDPSRASNYWVFTMEEIEYNVGGSIPSQPGGRGLSAFRIDMNLNGGLGGEAEYAPVLIDSVAEGLCAIRHSNGKDYWIICYETFPDFDAPTSFAVLALNKTGINKPTTYPILPSNSTDKVFVSDLKGAPDLRHFFKSPYLYDFNASTGAISNPVLLDPSIVRGEFSPNGKYLYATEVLGNGKWNIWRFDSYAANPAATKTLIAAIDRPNETPSGLQLANDGRIYHLSTATGASVVHRICDPNASMTALEESLFVFSHMETFGFLELPNFPAHLFYSTADQMPDVLADTSYICDAGILRLDARNPRVLGYQWSTGATTPTLTVNSPGKYSVTITTDCGTYADTTTVLQGPGIPSVEIDSTGDYCSNSNIILTAVLQGAGTLEWVDNALAGAVRTIDAAGLYEVIAENVCGSDTARFEFGIPDCSLCFALPNAFTPDADGNNDFFGPVQVCGFENYQMRIWNRWGQVVFESSSPNVKWSGHRNGELSPMDTYVYLMEYTGFTNGNRQTKTVKGQVTLIR